MHTVDYQFSFYYLPIAPGGPLHPALQVDLIRGSMSTKVIGVLDSGSTVTIFNPEHAQLLDIDDVTQGEPGNVATQAGRIDFYRFDLEMRLRFGTYQYRFPCRIGFFDVKRPRNILGRDFIFQHYEIGFRDRAQEVHLCQEL
jgi:hypothetical protein